MRKPNNDGDLPDSESGSSIRLSYGSAWTVPAIRLAGSKSHPQKAMFPGAALFWSRYRVRVNAESRRKIRRKKSPEVSEVTHTNGVRYSGRPMSHYRMVTFASAGEDVLQRDDTKAVYWFRKGDEK